MYNVIYVHFFILYIIFFSDLLFLDFYLDTTHMLIGFIWLVRFHAHWFHMASSIPYSYFDTMRVFCFNTCYFMHVPFTFGVVNLCQLPGADLLNNYNFKYGRSPYIEMPPAINPSGCARSEPKFRTHFRRCVLPSLFAGFSFMACTFM